MIENKTFSCDFLYAYEGSSFLLTLSEHQCLGCSYILKQNRWKVVVEVFERLAFLDSYFKHSKRKDMELGGNVCINFSKFWFHAA